MNPSISTAEKKESELALRIKVDKPAKEIVFKILLFCGILSSLLYVVMNVVVAMLYAGYSSVSQTVSELSAIGAPTRQLWFFLGIAYSLLMAAFGIGICQSAARNHSLKIMGALMLAYGTISLFWPPMHQRQVLATGGATFTDTMHIVFTVVTVLLMVLAIGYGAVAFGKRFCLYSIITLVLLCVFGTLTGLAAPHVQANLPTPLVGVWERINIGVFLLWVVILAIALLKMKTGKDQLKTEMPD